MPKWSHLSTEPKWINLRTSESHRQGCHCAISSQTVRFSFCSIFWTHCQVLFWEHIRKWFRKYIFQASTAWYRKEGKKWQKWCWVTHNLSSMVILFLSTYTYVCHLVKLLNTNSSIIFLPNTVVLPYPWFHIVWFQLLTSNHGQKASYPPSNSFRRWVVT